MICQESQEWDRRKERNRGKQREGGNALALAKMRSVLAMLLRWRERSLRAAENMIDKGCRGQKTETHESGATGGRDGVPAGAYTFSPSAQILRRPASTSLTSSNLVGVSPSLSSRLAMGAAGACPSYAMATNADMQHPGPMRCPQGCESSACRSWRARTRSPSVPAPLRVRRIGSVQHRRRSTWAEKWRGSSEEYGRNHKTRGTGQNTRGDEFGTEVEGSEVTPRPAARNVNSTEAPHLSLLHCPTPGPQPASMRDKRLLARAAVSQSRGDSMDRDGDEGPRKAARGRHRDRNGFPRDLERAGSDKYGMSQGTTTSPGPGVCPFWTWKGEDTTSNGVATPATRGAGVWAGRRVQGRLHHAHRNGFLLPVERAGRRSREVRRVACHLALAWLRNSRPYSSRHSATVGYGDNDNYITTRVPDPPCPVARPKEPLAPFAALPGRTAPDRLQDPLGGRGRSVRRWGRIHVPASGSHGRAQPPTVRAFLSEGVRRRYVCVPGHMPIPASRLHGRAQRKTKRVRPPHNTIGRVEAPKARGAGDMEEILAEAIETCDES
ncbi:hypothetical protein FB451DRAFT_1184322 [Mycena latifolia]|nr:hypothetical protein FB451DRAFT_1184322 [Mycena latifolia]